MATADAHTRLVNFAKIFLPLLALAILSTLFLFSGDINPNDAIPYAKIDVKEAAREQRLTNARYATVGTDGASIELSAAVARPEPGNAARVTANDIKGQIDLPDGTHLTLGAGSGTVDTDAQTASLTGDVKVDTSSGYSITAPALTVRLDRGEITSDGKVSVTTPYGTLEAGGMTLTRSKGPDATYRLLFNNQVKLVYVPPK